MYYCDNCKQTFSEDDMSVKNGDKCPHCGSIDIEEATLCQLCEEWGHTESYDGEHYCNECVEYIKKKFGDLIINNFDAKERKLIYWCIDVDEWISRG